MTTRNQSALNAVEEARIAAENARLEVIRRQHSLLQDRIDTQAQHFVNMCKRPRTLHGAARLIDQAVGADNGWHTTPNNELRSAVAPKLRNIPTLTQRPDDGRWIMKWQYPKQSKKHFHQATAQVTDIRDSRSYKRNVDSELEARMFYLTRWCELDPSMPRRVVLLRMQAAELARRETSSKRAREENRGEHGVGRNDDEDVNEPEPDPVYNDNEDDGTPELIYSDEDSSDDDSDYEEQEVSTHSQKRTRPTPVCTQMLKDNIIILSNAFNKDKYDNLLLNRSDLSPVVGELSAAQHAQVRRQVQCLCTLYRAKALNEGATWEYCYKKMLIWLTFHIDKRTVQKYREEYESQGKFFVSENGKWERPRLVSERSFSTRLKQFCRTEQKTLSVHKVQDYINKTLLRLKCGTDGEDDSEISDPDDVFMFSDDQLKHFGISRTADDLGPADKRQQPGQLKPGDTQHFAFQAIDPPPFYAPDLQTTDYVGKAKGIKQILWERGLWKENMTMKGSKNAMTGAVIKPSAKEALADCLDFSNEKTMLMEMVEGRGHVLMMTPICHPESKFLVTLDK